MIIETLLYYLFLAVMALSMAQGLLIGSLFFLKKSGDRRANAFYGLLLLAFGCTLAHNILTLTGSYAHYPRLYFLPIYFTLALPPLLFYHVKFSVYPAYQFRWTDLKHFVLPVAQWLFFWGMFFTDVEYKSEYGRRFFNPFFGAAEQALYLGTFIAYWYFARRYVRQKAQQNLQRGEARLVAYLRNLLKILFVLFAIHLVFVVADFVCYEFFGINLRVAKPYAALGALSFAALLDWLGVYGFQVLLWGRKVFRN
jgi:hypothetical protein